MKALRCVVFVIYTRCVALHTLVTCTSCVMLHTLVKCTICVALYPFVTCTICVMLHTFVTHTRCVALHTLVTCTIFISFYNLIGCTRFIKLTLPLAGFVRGKFSEQDGQRTLTVANKGCSANTCCSEQYLPEDIFLANNIP